MLVAILEGSFYPALDEDRGFAAWPVCFALNTNIFAPKRIRFGEYATRSFYDLWRFRVAVGVVACSPGFLPDQEFLNWLGEVARPNLTLEPRNTGSCKKQKRCKRGHADWHLRPDGWRVCRSCERERIRRIYAAARLWIKANVELVNDMVSD